MTWVQSPTRLLEVRFGYGTTEAGKDPPGLGSAGALEQFGLPGLPTDPRIAGGLPTQSITGYTGLGRQATNPQWQYPSVWNPKINYTWLSGVHSMKAGFEYQHVSTQVQDVNPLYGRDSYSGQFSRPAGAAAGNVYNLADFMLGLRSQYALSNVLVADIRLTQRQAGLGQLLFQVGKRVFQGLAHAGVRRDEGGLGDGVAHVQGDVDRSELRGIDVHLHGIARAGEVLGQMQDLPAEILGPLRIGKRGGHGDGRGGRHRCRGRQQGGTDGGRSRGHGRAIRRRGFEAVRGPDVHG